MDDDFDFGSYAPTIGLNSRSGSMKKLTRKNDKSLDNKSAAKNNDFDQLDELLNGDVKSKKKDTSLTKNPSTSQPKKNNDNFDYFFDEPSTNNLSLTSKLTDKKDIPPTTMDMAKTSTNFKVDKTDKMSDFDIIDEDHLLPNFTKVPREKSPLNNPIKLPQQSTLGLDLHTSVRNMRPPLKRKDSQAGLGNSNNLGLGLSLAQEKKQSAFKPTNTIELTLSNEPETKPSRTMGRRDSFENKPQKRFETNLTLLGQQPQKKQVGTLQFNTNNDKQQQSVFKMQNSPPNNKVRSTINDMKVGESIVINEKHSQFYNPQSIMISKPEDLKSSQAFVNKIDSNNYSFQKPATAKLVQPPKLSPQTVDDDKRSFNDYQKQIQHIKLAYQKQLNYLQESLDKQISISHETRERLMKEANSMIDQERKRMSRMHDEQVRRLKQMNDWQKKKMQDSYKFQIETLKSTINQFQQAKDKSQSTNTYQQLGNNKYKREVQLLSEQLQFQKKILLDRENHLTKKQFQLQEKYQELNTKKLRQQEYFRDQEKALLEKENKLKNAILNEKKQFMEEKQKLAMQAANMQLDYMRRKEKLELLIKEQQMQRQSIQNERHEMRGLNQQMMNRYKQKMNDLAQQKQRVTNLQAELLRKLRIVEMKAKESNIPLGEAQKLNSKQNNWVRDTRPQSTTGQKQQKLNDTFQRYNKIQKLANQKPSGPSKMSMTFNQHHHQGQDFRLQGYLTAMNKNSQKRINNFI